MNLGTILSSTASSKPDGVAIAFEDTRLTYAELDDRAGKVAGGLAALGVGPDDRVALWLPNHPDFAAALYGIWRLGATVVPLHAALTRPEAEHILGDCGAKVVFAGPDQVTAGAIELGGALGLERVVQLGDDFESFLAPSAPDMATRTDTDLAMIGYTSGTSGLPKGAMLTHGNLTSNLDQMRQTPIAMQEGDVVLCILPLFHIYGLNVVLNLSVRLGVELVLHERFDPAASIEAIGREGVTRIAGAPPAYVAWLAAGAPADAFSGVRVAVSGAAPLPKVVLEAFADRYGVTIWEGYGLTETAPALTTTAMSGVAKAGSVGRPLPGVELRLLDAEGEEVEIGDPGEVVVRGPNVFTGYWNAPDETARVLRDGWFWTSDVGVLDDDGDLFLVDRSRDMIIVSGFNVYPREVEEVLRRHPMVGDCAVVGVDDERSGEAVRALVVADPPGEAVTTEALLEHCRASLAPYKLPERIDFVDEIPRNAAGKVLRRVLRD